MFLIPGAVISVLTFPGVIVHEFAHALFCRLRGVAILDVCYFRVGDPSGYVVHEETRDFNSMFLIAMGPFIVNTLLCLIICLPAYLPIKIFSLGDPLSYLMIWLGISIGMHAIPSNQDASTIFQLAKERARERNVLAILSFPLVGAIYLFNLLRFFWADLIYGVAVGMGIPTMIYG